ncbi:MAG: hypothetical protein ACYS1C_01865 [Planctomycetota bacterium]
MALKATFAAAGVFLLVAAATPSERAARELPLLEPGSHLGVIVSFEPLPADVQAAVEAKWREAVSRGMSIGRVHTDWAVLEPRPGEYDKDALEQPLKALQADGLQPMLTLCTLDSEGYVLPPDLMAADDDGRLAHGIAFDDPVVLKRFATLLEWVVPMLVQYDGWVISVGNEPDNQFGDDPELPQRVARFVEAARNQVRSLSPDLAVTITLSGFAPYFDPPWLASVVSECDVACFNWGCVDENWDVKDPGAVPDDVADMLAAAGGRQLIIQELTCPAGYEDRRSVMGGTAEKQRRFFEKAIAEIEAQPRFRAAVVFQMVDWSPELTEAYGDIFRQAGLPDGWIGRLEELLRTVGLCRYEDGSARPAWFAFLEGLERLARARGQQAAAATSAPPAS